MTKKPNSKSEVERLARFFAFVYESNFLSYKRMVWLSFLRGVVQGIGGFIGATIGISVLLWLASVLLDIPLLGPIIESLRKFVFENS